ncbi:MAG: TolC family protein [Opitutales bacterium]
MRAYTKQLSKTPWAPLIMGAALMLGACTSPDISLEPNIQLNPSFSTGGDQPITDHWWEELETPELSAHIEAALDTNLSIEAAWQRLKAAEALAKRSEASRRIDVDGDLSARYRETDASDGAITGNRNLAARYEIDFWGRIEAEVEAQRLQSQVAFEDAETLTLTISSEVALAWLSLTESQLRKRLLENQLGINENIEKILLARFSSGQIDSADVLRQRQLIESTKQQLIGAEERIQLSYNRLQVLKGASPGAPDADDALSTFPELPPLPDPGVPSELIQKRPDVRAAYYELLSDDAALASAVADQYPRFDLSASLSSNSSSLAGLFETWTATLIGQVSSQVYDGGLRKSEIDRRAANVSEKVALYGQTILEACQEVEDALISEQSQKLVFESLKRELVLNEQTYGQLRSRYLNGASDYLSVLTNLRSGQQLQRDILSAQLDLLSNRVSLYRALSGGLDLERMKVEG